MTVLRLSILVLLFASVATPASANLIAFTVSPMNAELSVSPDTEQTGLITIRQDGPSSGDPQTLRLKAYAIDWSLDQTGGPKFLPANSTPQSCCSWLTINPMEVNVPGNVPITVRYTLHPPANANGEYRAMIMFQSAPQPSATDGRTMEVSGCIGAALYVQVGNAAKRAKVTAFSCDRTNTTLTIQNNGNTHLRLTGTMSFVDSTGKTVAKCSLPGAVVLPDGTGLRTLKFATPTLPDTKNLQATALVDYGADVLIGAQTSVSDP